MLSPIPRALRRPARALFCFGLFLPALCGAAAPGETPAPDTTAVLAIRQLSAEEAAKGYPVHVRGMVTYHEPGWFLTFVQDDTAGIYVMPPAAAIHPGDIVDVEGVTAPGKIGRILTGRGARSPQFRVIGHGDLPAPTAVSISDLRDDKWDAQWVSVRGEVRDVSARGDRALIVLGEGDAGFPLVIPGASGVAPRHLLGFPVEARGVLGTQVRDGKLGTALYVPGSDQITIDSAAFAARFESAPLRRMEWVYTGGSMLGGMETARLQGRVTFVRPGSGFAMNVRSESEENGCLFVQSTLPAPVSPGDLVEAVGKIDRAQSKPFLGDSVFRVIGRGEAPLPAAFAPTRLHDPNLRWSLVRTRGVVIEHLTGSGEEVWLLRCPEIGLVQARIARRNNWSPRLKPGAEVTATGVVSGIELSPGNNSLGDGAAFSMELRTEDDLTLVRPAPFWNSQRVAAALVLMSLCGCAAALWIVCLRRRVAQQTTTIRRQLQRETVSEERARIARDLHDTLAQYLAGVTMQIDAAVQCLATQSSLAKELLGTARAMASHSLDQARLAIWDLRSPALECAGLAAAIEESLGPLAHQAKPKLRIEQLGEPRRLGAVVEGHLLHIAHEAAANALRHAGASLILLSLRYESDQVTLTVSDDGCGFDSSKSDPQPGRRFGLRGIGERVKKLNATHHLTSAPGVGTTHTVIVRSPRPQELGAASEPPLHAAA